MARAIPIPKPMPICGDSTSRPEPATDGLGAVGRSTLTVGANSLSPCAARLAALESNEPFVVRLAARGRSVERVGAAIDLDGLEER